MEKKNAPACNPDQSVWISATYRPATAIHQIRAALERGERLTGMDALQRYGCSRLAAVIHTLTRRDGLPIQTQTIAVESAHGTTKHVSEYWIHPSPA